MLRQMRWILLMLTTLTLVSGLHDAHALMLAGLDPDAHTLLAAMSVTPDTTRQELISETIVALKEAGIWDELDTLWMTAAHDEQASRLNWKSPGDFTLQANGVITFTTDEGWQGDGSTGYLDTGWIPATDGVKYATNNASFGVYSRTNVMSGFDLGAQTSSATHRAVLAVRTGTNNISTVINSDSASNLSNPGSSSAGMFILRRNTATTAQVFRNGKEIGSVNRNSSNVPGIAFFIGAVNDAGTADVFTTRQYALVYTGAAMTARQHAAFYDAVQYYFIKVEAAILDEDVQAIVDAMESTPDTDRKVLINQLVKDLKEDGIWDELDTLWMMAAHDEQASRLNWKSPGDFMLSATGTMTFTVDRGWQSDGSTGYLDTGWIPATDGVKYVTNSASFGMYSRTNIARQDHDMGAENSNGINMAFIRSRFVSNASRFPVNHTNVWAPSQTIMDSRGFFVARRISAGTTGMLINGTLLLEEEISSSNPPSFSFYIGAVNRADSVLTPTLRQYALAFTGAAMTEQQQTSLYDAVQAYLDGCGAAVWGNEVQAIIDAMNPEPEVARKLLIDKTVRDLKTAGIWDELDTLWVMAAHDEQASRLNWKSPGVYDLTLVNQPAFTRDRGFQGNGNNSYLDTNFVPGTDGVNYTLNNASFGVYSRTNLSISRNDMGAANASNTARSDMFLLHGTGYCIMRINVNTNINSASSTVTNSLGLHASRRTSATDVSLVKNGLVIASDNATSGLLPEYSFYIGGHNVAGTLANAAPRQYAFAFTGSAMTEQQHGEFYDIMQNGYLRAVGAAVYFTDFSEYDTGMPPDGWSIAGGTFDVLEGTYTGGKALRHRGLSPSPNSSYWSEIGQFDDVEILCRLRPVNDGFNRSHIGLRIGNVPLHFRRQDGVNDRIILGISSLNFFLFPWSANWHYMRIRRIGTTGHGKVWRADNEEPEDWQISSNIGDVPVSVGISIMQNANNLDAFWDTFEVRSPITPTPTNTPTSTHTPTPTVTPTFTPTNTPTNTPTEKPPGEPASVSRWRDYD